MKILGDGCGSAFLTVIGFISLVLGVAALSVGQMGYGIVGVVFSIVMFVAAIV